MVNPLQDKQLSQLVRDGVSRSSAWVLAGLTGLNERSDPFGAVVRATQMPIVITNPREADNPIAFVNDAFCRLTGYPRNEMLGRNCRFLQGPNSDPAAVARLRAAIRNAEPIEIDIQNYCKDGQPFWNRMLIAPVCDEDGALMFFFASQTDVTAERELLTSLERHNAALKIEVASRLHAEDAQHNSEARLRFAAQAGRLGIWEYDLQTTELTVSAVFEDSFGRNRASPLIYGKLESSVHPGDRDRMAAAIQHSVAAGTDFEIEYRVAKLSGDIAWVQVRAQLERAADGTAQRMAGILLDVTEHRRAELRLRATEHSIHLATEAADIGTWSFDAATHQLTWSDRKRAMFGISPGLPVGIADFFAGLHPEDRETVGAAFNAAMDPHARAIYDIEFRTVGKEDGIVRWVAAKGKGLFEEGTCSRVIGTAIDITQRKLASNRQAFLLELLDRLRALTEPLGILDAAAQALGRYLSVDRVGYVQFQSDEATFVLEHGYGDGVEPVTGTFRLDVFGTGGIARLRQGLTVACEDATLHSPYDPVIWAAVDARSFVTVPLVRDGQLRAGLYVSHRQARFWAPDEMALIEDVAGRVWEVVERARAEAALRETNEVLEARVTERTRALVEANEHLRAEATGREIVEEALRQSQKMEAVGQLTGGIAHDFNNMLQGVGGSLELMRRRMAQGRTTEADRLGDMAVEGIARAAALTHRLLAFARRQALQPRAVDPDKLIAGMAELVRNTVGPGIAVELKRGDNTWLVRCDANQLESALLNLAINARDAMPHGGVLSATTAYRHLLAVDVAGHNGVAPGDYAEITISDTGVGMPPDVVARAFEPFFTTKPLGQGTGLGLSQLYGFMRQSNGFVRLHSVPGEGTTVRLYLPRHPETVMEPDAPAPEQARPWVEMRRTVLVVEDEPDVCLLICETLREMGYCVISANDGLAGLDMLQSNRRVDLLVTDVGLPGLNGRQLADAAQQTRPGLPVLLVTGYAGAALADWALGPGMEVMGKPFTLDALSVRIGTMLDRRRQLHT